MLRELLGAGALLAVVASRDAQASVSVQVTWDALLHDSTAAVVATPVETTSVWEGGRIYSYAHLRVDRALAGELHEGDGCWVRTMGGVVGKIGQIVDGEAVLAGTEPSVLFLHRGPPGAFVVTARAQGQFALVQTGDPAVPPRLVKSSAVGALVPPAAVGPTAPPRFAADVVHGRLVDDVARDVAAAWDRAHAR